MKVMNHLLKKEDWMNQINLKRKYIKYYDNKRCKLLYLNKQIRDNIHELSLIYKNSFKKNVYMKFKNVGDLCDYRLEIIYKQHELQEHLDSVNKEINYLNNYFSELYNDLLYYEIMYNKMYNN